MSDAVARLNAALEGRYAIERELGEGGMATVYLADDLKHERKVALKVLKPELAAVVGAERFLAEITTTANLTHPHILPLHDSGEADSFLFYVMPHIEGESLRERIDREKQLGVDDAVAITQKVAGALDYAHSHGVVHRDIKPGNILLSEQGEPLVADFGIALAVAQAGAGRITETGLSLGTPHYMSPEQATGDRDVDPRSDVYALGCVLYEMLSGQPPFSATTAQAVLVKILTMDAPSITSERRTVPPHVGHALARALEKLPADRFMSAAEFAAALGDESFTYKARPRTSVTASTTEPLGTQAPAPVPGPWKRLTMSFAALFVVSTLGFGWALLRPAPPRPVTRVSVRFPADQIFRTTGARGGGFDLSSDGSLLIYNGIGDEGQPQLWARRRDALRASPIPVPEGFTGSALSPDGREVAVTVDFSIRIIPLDGTVGRTVATDAVRCCVRWGPEGDWLYFQNRARGLSRVAAQGGPPNVLTTVDPTGFGNAWLDVLPGGRTAVFQASSVIGVDSRLMTLDLETRQVAELAPGRFPRYANGYLFHTDEGDTTLMATPFDPVSLALDGPPAPVVEGLAPPPANFTWASYAVSSSGTLVYSTGNRGTVRVPMWVGRDGAAQPIDSNFRGPYSAPKLSPDGSKLAVSGGAGIFVKDLDDGPLIPLAFDGTLNYRPSWSSDSTSIVYASNRLGRNANDFAMYSVRPDGVGSPEPLGLASPSATASRDGNWWIYRTNNNEADLGNIMAVRVGSDSEPISLVATPYQEAQAGLSPDGQWFAYSSERSGIREVYVRPFPNADDDRVPVSIGGGSSPVWANLGRELFYVDAESMLVAATFATTPSFRIVSREPLFSVADYGMSSISPPDYDVTRDDQKFVMMQIGDEGEASELILVENWFEELRQRMGN